MRKVPENEKRFWGQILFAVCALLFAILSGTGWLAYELLVKDHSAGEQVIASAEDSGPAVVDGKDVETGLVVDTGWEKVKRSCTSCHSAKLITQNRMTREGWLTTIRWMQETQNLGQLGDNEAVILDYLAKNYAPKKRGRRAPLENVEWYVLEEEE